MTRDALESDDAVVARPMSHGDTFIHAGTPGALVLGGDYQGLGIVRSLGRRNIAVGIVDDESSIAASSRFARFSKRVKSLADESIVDELLEIGAKNGLDGWVLFPTRDETVAILSRHRETLAKRFRVATPGWDSIKWAWDKRNTYCLAQSLGIPAPKTWYLDELSDLDQLDGHYPLALKPSVKDTFVRETGKKAWRADNQHELRVLLARANRLIPPEQIMIQDLIPGDGSCQYAYCAFFKDGEAIGKLMARRRRQHPFEFGRASTYVESVNIPELEEYSLRFLGATKFYGLVELEYKLDPRDGKYRLLDVNARTWGYHTIGRPAGVDFPFMLFSDQVGKTPEPSCGKLGVRWVRLLTDVPTGMLGIAKGKFNWASYLESLLHFDEEAVFSVDDPMPGLLELTLLPYLSVKRGF